MFQSETHFHIIYMDVRFPPNYPLEPPDFEFQGRTTLSQDRGFAIVKKLKAIAQGLKNQACLEPCLRVYEQEIMAIIAEEKKAAIGAKYSFRDSNVPYPRISGARFCGRGQLVCFGWSFTVHVPSTGEATRAAKKTPRALSAISGNAAAAGASRLSTTPTLSPMIKVAIPEPPPMPKPPSNLGNGSHKHKMVRIASVPSGLKPKNGSRRVNSESQELDPELHNGRFVPVTTRPHITIYDATQALNFSVDLAMNYKINGPSISQVCL